MEVAIFLFGMITGILCQVGYLELRKYLDNKKIKDIFSDVLVSIESGHGVFSSRVHDHITILMRKGPFIGKHIVYDKKGGGITIFDDKKVWVTSDVVRAYFSKSTILDDLIDEMNYRFKEKIDDYVIVSGVKIDRGYLDTMMKQHKDDFFYDSPINQEQKESFDLDSILDKINKVGIENLTEKEKNYLNKFSNGK